MSAVTHDALVRAAADGDDAALEALVHAYHDRVYRFGLRACHDAFDADDAVQEAFTKLATRPDVMRDPGLLSWLFTVVKNTCLRLLRPFLRERRTLGERSELEVTPDDAPSPEAALARLELVRAVHDAIAGLPPDERDVLLLRDLEGLSGDETSRALGVSAAAMKSRLHRGRAAVRAFVSARERERARQRKD